MYVVTVNIPYYPYARLFDTLEEAKQYVREDGIEADALWWAQTGVDTFYTISEVAEGKYFEATDESVDMPIEKSLNKGE